MNRRTFLRAGLVLAAAPAIVRAESIMPVRAVSDHAITVFEVESGWQMYDSRFAEYLRAEVQTHSRFREFCDIPDTEPKREGETFHWNIYGDTLAIVPKHEKNAGIASVFNEIMRQQNA